MENCESDKTVFWRDLEEQSWKNMRCWFWTVISTKKFSEVLLSLTSLLPLSWGRPSTLSGKSHVTHPWNRYPDQMTFRRRHEAHLTLQITPRAWTQACVMVMTRQRPFDKSVITFLWRLHLEFWSHVDEVAPSFWWKATGYILWD